MTHSVLDENLIANYRRANYQIGIAANSIILRIDQYSEPLAKLLTTFKQTCAAVISAYNPFSQQLSNEENLAAHELLRNSLRGYLYPMIESLNTDLTNTWPAEKSFFVLGLKLDTAKWLGLQFNQNAIVWIDNDAIPRLILLR